MRADVLVRRAEPGDIEGVLRVERGAKDAPHWDEARYREMVEGDQLAALRRALFVAVRGEQVMGFVVGAVVLDEAELESVAVDEAYRRLGVGRALSEVLLEWAAALGASVMRLEVRWENVGAQTMYERLGFHQCGLRRGYYADPLDDAVLMMKGLG